MNPVNSTEDLSDDIRSIVALVSSLFDEIYLVGGAVRDSIMGRETKDLDFAVPDSVNDVEKIITKNKLFKVRTQGMAFGTIAAMVGDYDIQITTYREDKYVIGSRKPNIRGVADIDSDLSRRDFTINAMALSSDEFIDPYNGYADIKSKTIRIIGDPSIKLMDDPLRILRAFRLSSQLGFQIAEQTLESAIAYSSNLQIVSSERQGDELKKLLAGPYWADALNEITESGVMNELLKSFGYTYKVSADDIHHEFEKYSIKELEDMDIVRRWCYLVKVLQFAEHAAGITSSDTTAIADMIMNAAQVQKTIKSEVVAELDRIKTDDDINPSQQLDSLKREVAILKTNNDPRSMIAEARYHTILGREAIDERKYALARKELGHAISITEENYDFIINQKDQLKKTARLRGITPFYLSRLKYFITSIILEEKLHAKYHSSDKLALFLKKSLKPKHVSKDQLMEAIDLSIAYVYRQRLRDITLESYDDFLAKKDLHIKAEQRERYLFQYIESMIRDPSTSVSTKARLYNKKAKLAAKGKDPADFGLEYYDPYIDHLYNKMLCTKSLDQFKDVFKEFEVSIEQYLQITKKTQRLWAGNRKKYLTTASGLVYALSLAQTLNDKIGITSDIILNYTNAGRGFEKNQARYTVYLEWFQFTQTLLTSNYSESALQDLINQLSQAKSLSYVDIDENYLSENKPDIVKKRSLLKDSLVFLKFLQGADRTADKVNDETLKCIITLMGGSLIDVKSAFTIYKNFVSIDENKEITAERIELSDRELKERTISEVDEYLIGESENIEYKSSWSFDLAPFRASGGKVAKNNDELKSDVIKNIAGFMNKSGGVLLVGVEDDCTVCGLEETDFRMQSSKDPRKKIDNIQLDIRNWIISKLSKEVLAEISMEAISYRDKTIIKIKVPKSIGPVIYKDGDDERYYVRSGTSTSNAGWQALLKRSQNI